MSSRWQKGQSGNPAGRPKLPAPLLDVKELTHAEINRTIAKHMRMTKSEIDLIVENPSTSALDLSICKILLAGISAGDPAKINFLLDRSIGRVKEEIEITKDVRAIFDEIPREKIIELVLCEEPKKLLP